MQYTVRIHYDHHVEFDDIGGNEVNSSRRTRWRPICDMDWQSAKTTRRSCKRQEAYLVLVAVEYLSSNWGPKMLHLVATTSLLWLHDKVTGEGQRVASRRFMGTKCFMVQAGLRKILSKSVALWLLDLTVCFRHRNRGKGGPYSLWFLFQSNTCWQCRI